MVPKRLRRHIAWSSLPETNRTIVNCYWPWHHNCNDAGKELHLILGWSWNLWPALCMQVLFESEDFEGTNSHKFCVKETVSSAKHCEAFTVSLSNSSLHNADPLRQCQKNGDEGMSLSWTKRTVDVSAKCMMSTWCQSYSKLTKPVNLGGPIDCRARPSKCPLEQDSIVTGKARVADYLQVWNRKPMKTHENPGPSKIRGL